MNIRKVGYGFLNAKNLIDAVDNAHPNDQLSISAELKSSGVPIIFSKSLTCAPRERGEKVVLRDPLEVAAGVQLVLQDLAILAPITLQAGATLQMQRCVLAADGDALIMQAGA